MFTYKGPQNSQLSNITKDTSYNFKSKRNLNSFEHNCPSSQEVPEATPLGSSRRRVQTPPLGTEAKTVPASQPLNQSHGPTTPVLAAWSDETIR